MRILMVAASCLGLAAAALGAPDASQEFAKSIRPVLARNCGACHDPSKAKNPAAFLKAAAVSDIDANRALWRNVASQMRNRTMPPVASKLTEEDRFRIASWIDNRLRQTACSVGEYAGPAIARRLNRREYHNTIRDLLGIDFDALSILPADGTGGAGFDTNGETLYVPPMLMEKYMEAAQQILDRVVITPALSRSYAPVELKVEPGKGYSVGLSVYQDAAYDLQAMFEPKADPKTLTLEVDGAAVGEVVVQRRRPSDPLNGKRPIFARAQVNLARGSHTLALVSTSPINGLERLTIQQKADAYSSEKHAAHYRLFGMEPGERPLQARKAARQILETVLAKAVRRPIEPSEVDRFLVLYDRAAERGDPYEERLKLALKAVLVWPEFLFRIEKKEEKPGIYPLGQYELAARLSYFLWSTMPDEALTRVASEGRLQDPKTLDAQVDRMLDDLRSRAFVNSFVGQWLGTQDIGGRVVPLLTELQSYYTPEVAADLRTQPILLLDRILGENRSLIELLDAN